MQGLTVERHEKKKRKYKSTIHIISKAYFIESTVCTKKGNHDFFLGGLFVTLIYNKFTNYSFHVDEKFASMVDFIR